MAGAIGSVGLGTAQVSPEGRQVALDLLGVLWLVPARGGQAKRLTGDLFDIAMPTWSPDCSALEALTTTSIAGEALAEPPGRIARGCYADLVVLGADPLTR
ncbi:hypothetical protein AB0383_09180 [Amycolatopsis sp. NPDC051373]|uniref:hypothetical protein n=1 Tax=Amycolatopsis sp. NPDC051373 TaxID=3155801 RepID=UPI0034508B2E